MRYLSNIITTASGSAAGLTAQRTHAGNTLRGRITPTKRRPTGLSDTARFQRIAAHLWSEVLDEATRDRWRTIAGAVPDGFAGDHAGKPTGPGLFRREVLLRRHESHNAAPNFPVFPITAPANDFDLHAIYSPPDLEIYFQVPNSFTTITIYQFIIAVRSPQPPTRNPNNAPIQTTIRQNGLSAMRSAPGLLIHTYQDITEGDRVAVAWNGARNGWLSTHPRRQQFTASP